jgi:hypothetical protein
MMSHFFFGSLISTRSSYSADDTAVAAIAIVAAVVAVDSSSCTLSSWSPAADDVAERIQKRRFFARKWVCGAVRLNTSFLTPHNKTDLITELVFFLPFEMEIKMKPSFSFILNA